MSVRVVVDCRGLNCPQPVLKAKDALEQMSAGEIEIIVDNEASRSNVERFAQSQGCSAAVTPDGEVFRVVISKPAGARPADGAPDPAQYTCQPGQSGLVHVISSDIMGRGSEELGRVLMRAYIKTIKDVDPLPRKILFYNSGVKITASESDLIAPLRDLEARGVEILSCGTCLDFFNLKENLMIGKPTNMYEIMQSMAGASGIVSPY